MTKNEKLSLIIKYFILFWIGGSAYVTIEVFYRMHSHWSMFLLGGLCFIIIGLINEYIPWNMSIIKQGIIGACIITVLEFMVGLIVNIWLGLDIWDYSTLPLNIMGQICLPFTLIWFFIALLAIVVDDYLRYLMFNEDMPNYYLFSKRNGR